MARPVGVMIPAAAVDAADVASYAAANPHLKRGLLLAAVRPWLIGMNQ
jgi:hypothetical protein